MDEKLTLQEVLEVRQALEADLAKALAKMTYSMDIQFLRERLEGLKDLCPHQGEGTDYTLEDECPFCKKKFDHSEE